MTIMEDHPAILSLTQSESREVVTIERKAVNEAPKVLGCLIQANGSWKAEQDRWTSTALQFAMKVKKGQFDRICGAKLYPSYWISKFRYVAPVVGFSKLFCESTGKPVVASCLSATGFNIRFPRAVVFGSYKYGGMQW